jgi:hypothetical protein
VNVQVTADAAQRLVWASAALPGSTDGLTAARTHGVIDTLTKANVMTFADRGTREPAVASEHRSNSPEPTEAVPPAGGRQPDACPHRRPQRTRQRHPKDLEILTKPALPPAPSDRDRADHPRPTTSRTRSTEDESLLTVEDGIGPGQRPEVWSLTVKLSTGARGCWWYGGYWYAVAV